MRVLGVDPGSRVTGWGLVAADGWETTRIAHGAVRCRQDAPLPQRLLQVGEALDAVIAEHSPDVVAVEQVFAARNARSALVLGHARGVVLLCAARAGLPLHEYSPSQVKNAVTGNGRAEKEQVRLALTTQLCLPEPPRPLDASDALAIALCHAASVRFVRHLDAVERAGDAP